MQHPSFASSPYTPREWEQFSFSTEQSSEIYEIYQPGNEPGSQWHHYRDLGHPALAAWDYDPEHMEFAIVSDEEFKAMGLPQFAGDRVINLGRLITSYEGYDPGTPVLHLTAVASGVLQHFLFVLVT
jgi:hypothetical protein